jgi:hypothetical protein
MNINALARSLACCFFRSPMGAMADLKDSVHQVRADPWCPHVRFVKGVLLSDFLSWARRVWVWLVYHHPSIWARLHSLHARRCKWLSCARHASIAYLHQDAWAFAPPLVLTPFAHGSQVEATKRLIRFSPRSWDAVEVMVEANDVLTSASPVPGDKVEKQQRSARKELKWSRTTPIQRSHPAD